MSEAAARLERVRARQQRAAEKHSLRSTDSTTPQRGSRTIRGTPSVTAIPNGGPNGRGTGSPSQTASPRSTASSGRRSRNTRPSSIPVTPKRSSSIPRSSKGSASAKKPGLRGPRSASKIPTPGQSGMGAPAAPPFPASSGIRSAELSSTGEVAPSSYFGDDGEGYTVNYDDVEVPGIKDDTDFSSADILSLFQILYRTAAARPKAASLHGIADASAFASQVKSCTLAKDQLSVCGEAVAELVRTLWAGLGERESRAMVLNAQCEDSAKQLAAQRASMAATAARSQGIQAALQTAEANVESLRKQLAEAREANGAKEPATADTSDTSELTTALTQSQSHATQLETELSALKERVEQAETRHTEERERLESQLADLHDQQRAAEQAEKSEKAEAVTALTSELSRVKAALAEAETENTALKAKEADAVGAEAEAVAALSAELQHLKSKLSEAETGLTTTREELASCVKERDSLATQTRELSADVDAKARDAQLLEEQLRAAEAARQVLQEQLTEAQNDSVAQTEALDVPSPASGNLKRTTTSTTELWETAQHAKEEAATLKNRLESAHSETRRLTVQADSDAATISRLQGIISGLEKQIVSSHDSTRQEPPRATSDGGVMPALNLSAVPEEEEGDEQESIPAAETDRVYASVRVELDRYRAIVPQLVTQIDQLKSLLNTASSEVASSMISMKANEDKVSELTTALHGKTIEADKLGDALEAARQDAAATREQFETATAELRDGHRRELESAHERYMSELHLVQEQLADKARALKESQAASKAHTHDKTGLEAELADLRRERAFLQTRVSELDESQALSAKLKADLDVSASLHRSELGQLDADLNRVKSRAEEAEQAVADGHRKYEEEVQARSQVERTLREELAAATSQLEESLSVRHELEIQLEASATKASHIAKENETLNEKLSELDSALRNHKLRSTALQASTTNLEQQLRHTDSIAVAVTNLARRLRAETKASDLGRQSMRQGSATSLADLATASPRPGTPLRMMAVSRGSPSADGDGLSEVSSLDEGVDLNTRLSDLKGSAEDMITELGALRRKNRDLKSHAAATESEVESLKSARQIVETELSEARSALEAAELRHQLLASDLQDTKTSALATASDMEAMALELDDAREEAQHTAMKLDEARGQLSELRTKLSASQQQVANLRSDLERKTKWYDDDTRTLRAEATRLENDLAHLRSLQDVTQAQATRDKAVLLDTNRQLSDLKTELELASAHADQRVESVKREHEELSQDRQRAEDTVRTMEAKIKDMSNDRDYLVQMMKEMMEEKTHEAQRLQSQVEKLTTKANELETAYEEAKIDLSAAREEITRGHSALTKEFDNKERLRKQAEAAQEQLRQAELRRTRLQERIDGDISNHSEHLQGLQVRLKELAQERDTAVTLARQAGEEIAMRMVQEALKDSFAEKESLETQLGETTAQLTTLQTEYDTIKTQVVNLQTLLTNAEVDVAKTRARLKETEDHLLESDERLAQQHVKLQASQAATASLTDALRLKDQQITAATSLHEQSQKLVQGADESYQVLKSKWDFERSQLIEENRRLQIDITALKQLHTAAVDSAESHSKATSQRVDMVEELTAQLQRTQHELGESKRENEAMSRATSELKALSETREEISRRQREAEVYLVEQIVETKEKELLSARSLTSSHLSSIRSVPSSPLSVPALKSPRTLVSFRPKGELRSMSSLRHSSEPTGQSGLE